MELSRMCFTWFNMIRQSITDKFNKLQTFLESKFPKLRGTFYGKCFICAVLLSSVVFMFGVLDLIISSSSEGEKVQTSERVLTLAGQNCLTLTRDVAEGRKSVADIFNVIWQGFYGRNYRKNLFKAEIAKYKGEPIIRVNERPWEGSGWSTIISETINGVTHTKIDKNPDKIIFADVGLILSVNDQGYQQWKESSHYLLQKIAVPKDDAASGYWLAGMWFGVNSTTVSILQKCNARSTDYLESIAELNIWAEALDGKGNVIVKENGKPLRECISINKFERPKSKHKLPLGARVDNILELGRVSDFNHEEQAPVKKKMLINGKETLIEEVYASNADIESLEEAAGNDISTDVIFKMVDYIVIKIVDGGIIAANPQLNDTTIFLETPLQFLKGEKLPEGYVRFISSSSKEGKSIRHFRQVLRKALGEGFHREIEQDSASRSEYASAVIRFDYISENEAKSIASVRCWIEDVPEGKSDENL